MAEPKVPKWLRRYEDESLNPPKPDTGPRCPLDPVNGCPNDPKQVATCNEC